MMHDSLLLSRMLEHAQRHHPRREIVSRQHDGMLHRESYAELGRRARQLAAGLQSLGVRPGTRVATVALNSYRHMETYYAVAGIGSIYHTINPRLTPDQIVQMLGHAGDEIVLFDPAQLDLIRAVAPAAPGVRWWISLSEHPVELAGPTLAFDEIIEAHDPIEDWPELDEESGAALCYTSGTTGAAKGVLYSHRALVIQAMAACLPDAENIGARDVILAVVPMFHVNGWGLPYSASITGAGLALPGNDLGAAALVELINDAGVTLAAGVPTVWQSLLQYLDQTGAQIPSVERVICGGSAPAASMVAAFEDRGIEFMHGWGMTETTAACTFSQLLPSQRDLPLQRRRELKTSQGRAMFPVRMRLVDEHGHELPWDGRSAGELQVQGPWVTGSYYLEPEPCTVDGWLPTGDIVTIDDDTFMRISDRAKDSIKSGGEWISSVALEATIADHPGIYQVGVVSVPDNRWGERPAVFAVAKPGAEQPTLAEIRALVVETAPAYWAPDYLVWLDELPLGPTGKILKRRLRETWIAEHSAKLVDSA
jgi:fatty-acyl-CoA synthase